jgi:hypothetical protein
VLCYLSHSNKHTTVASRCHSCCAADAVNQHLRLQPRSRQLTETAAGASSATAPASTAKMLLQGHTYLLPTHSLWEAAVLRIGAVAWWGRPAPVTTPIPTSSVGWAAASGHAAAAANAVISSSSAAPVAIYCC